MLRDEAHHDKHFSASKNLIATTKELNGHKLIGYCDPSNYHKAKAKAFTKTKKYADEDDDEPSASIPKAVVIKMEELKKTKSAEDQKYSFVHTRKQNSVGYQSLQQTPEKKGKRMKFSRASMQYNYITENRMSIIQSEQKEDIKKMLENHETFNMRNSKVMDSCATEIKNYSRPASLHKKRQQRKMWQRKKKE